MEERHDPRPLVEAIVKWAKAPERGWRGGGGSEFTYLQLYTRPEPREPEVQVTLRAALVDGAPVIQVEYSGRDTTDATQAARRASGVAMAMAIAPSPAA